jgi:serine/threonine protein kinase
MAAHEYDTLCHEISKELLDHLVRKNEESRRFAPYGTAESVLHRDKLLRFFRSLPLPGNSVEEQFQHTEADLVTKVGERKLYRFLAVLVSARCSIQAARCFTSKVVAPNELLTKGHTISLPADFDQLKELFDGDQVAADGVFTKQACFCPVTILNRKEVRIENPQYRRLPYLEEQPLDEGSFGTVYRVKIAKGHFFDPENNSTNLEPKEIARKDYQMSSRFPPPDERKIMDRILNSSSRRCENILENFGSIAIGQETYSLFMPLAMCDLRAYMMGHHELRPSTNEEKAKMIQCARGLAGGLRFLHNEMETSHGERMVCYHLDLKPRNVLIFSEGQGDETRLVWKISDFGMSCVKISQRNVDVEKERDFKSFFVQRTQTQDPSFSAAENRRGAGTYLAPESTLPVPSMKTESDVWSLGCVISVVFAYLEEGSDGVTRFQDARIAHRDSDDSDRFFRSGRFRPLKTHPAIKSWHTRLIDKASQRSSDEGRAVRYMLRYLERCVFQIDPTQRDGAKGVEETLRQTFLRYTTLSSQPLRPSGDTGDGRWLPKPFGELLRPGSWSR